MKLSKKIFIAIFSLIFFAVACKDSFLDVPATGSLSDAQLTSQKGIEGALVAAYSVLTGRGYDFYAGSTNWFWGSVMGGEANKGTNSGDQAQMNEVQRYATLTTNGSNTTKYRTLYEGVARSNGVLALIAKSTALSDADKKRISGEARFLRAHYYFELARMYKQTPYVDENSSGVVKNDQNLWPKIEADFQFAYDNLPETQNALGRANKWAAGAYLGKVKLYQKKYNEAKTLFDAVITSGKNSAGVKYALVARYGDLFRAGTADNNTESVFQIQAAINTGSVANANPDFVLNFPYNGGPAGCCGFNQPSFDLVNSFRTDANGLPLIDGSYNNAGNRVKSDQNVAADAAFTPDAGNLDPRLDHSVGRRGIEYLGFGPHPGVSWIRDQSYGGPYAPKKYVFSKGDAVDNSSWTPGYTGQNVSIIRFADVLLMAAEAEVELGNLETARGYVNQVRSRAANTAGYLGGAATPAANYVITTYSTTWTDANVARNAVRFERKLELSGEGHRFFDLVRWGIAKATLDAYLANEVANGLTVAFGGATFTTNKSEYLPIPQPEIDLVGAGNLTQNPGY